MSETNLLDNELKMLVRASRNERFRFIIIQYNHFSLINKVKKTLLETYSKRNSCSINLDKLDQKDFIQNILNCKTGFVFIEEFENLLKEDFRSLAIGFNQRRDKFSEYPITIIAFLPTGEKYLQQCQTIMPDVFSLVNPIIMLNIALKPTLNLRKINEARNNNFKNIKEAQFEVKLIEKRLKTLEKNQENLELRVDLIRRIVEAKIFMAEYNNGIKILSSLLNEFQEQLSNEQNFLIRNDLGVIYSNLENYKKAQSLFLKSREFIKSENSNLITFNNNLGENYANLNKLNKALEYLKLALSLCLKIEGDVSLNLGYVYSNLGLVYEYLSDFNQARICFERGVSIQLANSNEPNSSLAVAYNNMSGLYAKQKDYENALFYSHKSLEIRLKIFNESHPDTANSLNNIGTIYSFIGNYDKAKSYYLKSYQALLKTFGKNHPNTLQVKENLFLLN